MKTLNSLIDELIAVRAANPALGARPITVEDPEVGANSEIDIVSVAVEDAGVMLMVSL